MERRLLLLAASFLPAAPALAQNTAAQPAARRLSGTEYLAMSLMGGTLAKQTSQLAQQRATNPRVKEFAGFEVAEQTALAQVLTNTDNPPPVPLDAEHASQLQALQGVTGAGFDRAYIAAQIQQHQELLAVQNGYLGSNNRSTDTQHIAVLARMSIQQHLVMLQDLERVVSG